MPSGKERDPSDKGAIMDTGIPEESVPEDLIERLGAFYISGSTYLGQLVRQRNCAGFQRGDQSLEIHSIGK